MLDQTILRRELAQPIKQEFESAPEENGSQTQQQMALDYKHFMEERMRQVSHASSHMPSTYATQGRIILKLLMF